jgi:hypothetical protein
LGFVLFVSLVVGIRSTPAFVTFAPSWWNPDPFNWKIQRGSSRALCGVGVLPSAMTLLGVSPGWVYHEDTKSTKGDALYP